MKLKGSLVVCSLSIIPLSGYAYAGEITKMDKHCYEITHADRVNQPENQQCLKSFIEEVVITGTRTVKTPRLHPGSLSVINQMDLERSTVGSVAELLQDIPGVQISDAGQAGSKRIRIRGEESRRVAILVDNQEITDHREVGVPLTLNQEMIERVEIVRGASSVLYGSKAIGGVVNFITKKGGYHPLQGTASVGYNGANDGHDEFVSLYGSSGDIDYRLSAAQVKNKELKSPEGDIENTRSNSKSLSMYMGAQLSDRQRVELNVEDYQSDSQVFVEEAVRTHSPFVDFAIDVPQRDREKLGFLYRFDDISESVKKIEFSAYHQTNDRQFNTFPSVFIPPGIERNTSIYTASELVTQGALLQADWLLPSNNYLITGIQYLNDDMDQNRLKIITETSRVFPPAPPNQSVSREQSSDAAEMKTLAAFVQNEWSYSENLALTLGARQYWVDAKLSDSATEELSQQSVDDKHAVVAFSVLYSGQENFVWRLNASQGYVYPSLLQMATGAYGGSSYISPNADLKPETSDNFELGMRYFSRGWQLDLTAFYSESKDYIDHIPCDKIIDDCIDLSRKNRIYKNIGTSTNQGLEMLVEYNITDTNITPYLSMAWMERENDYGNFSTKKTGWPELSGRMGARYDNSFSNNTFWIDGYLRAESSADEETPKGKAREIKENSGWETLNLSSGISFGSLRQYKVVVDALNLSDRSYSTATENLLAPKRHLRLSLTANF